MKTFKQYLKEQSNLIDMESIRYYDFLTFERNEELAKLASIFINGSEYKNSGIFVAEYKKPRSFYKGQPVTHYFVLIPPNFKKRTKFRKELGNYIIKKLSDPLFDPYSGWFNINNHTDWSHPRMQSQISSEKDNTLKRYEAYDLSEPSKDMFGSMLGSI
jgi:hypothetical protein